MKEIESAYSGVSPPVSPGLSRYDSPELRFNESVDGDGMSPPVSPRLNKRQRDASPSPEESPMPSEPKREKPIIKFNADLPAEPGEKGGKKKAQPRAKGSKPARP